MTDLPWLPTLLAIQTQLIADGDRKQAIHQLLDLLVAVIPCQEASLALSSTSSPWTVIGTVSQKNEITPQLLAGIEQICQSQTATMISRQPEIWGIPLLPLETSQGVVLLREGTFQEGQPPPPEIQPILQALRAIVLSANREIASEKPSEKLSEQPSELQSPIVEHIPQTVYLLDQKTQKIQYLNGFIPHLLGYSLDHFPIELQTLTQLIHPQDRHLFQPHSRSATNPREVEFRMKQSDGTWRWLRAWERLLPHPTEHQSSLILGMWQDIHHRKQSDLELQKNYRLLQTMVGESPDMIAAKNRHGELVFFNASYVEFFQQSPEKLLGRTDRELWPIEIAHRLRTMERDIMRSGVAQTYEEQIPRPHQVHTYLTTTIPWQDEQNNILGTISIMRDITAQTAALQELKQVETALREREEFLSSIHDGVEQVIFVVEVLPEGDFRFLSLNPAGERLSGTTAADFCQATPSARVRANYQRCIEAGQTITYEEFINFSATACWWETTLSPLRNDQGRIYRLIGTSGNITQRKLAEAELRESESRFRQLAQQEALFNRLASQIRASLDLDMILSTAVQELFDLLKLDRCLFIWYHRQPEPTWHVVHETHHPQLSSLLGRYPALETQGLAARLQQSDLTIDAIHRVSAIADPSEREFFENLGYQSLVNLPIQTSSGSMGVMSCTMCHQERLWLTEELELLQAIVNQLSIAISQAELYTQSQYATYLAEEKAQALTAALQELKQAQTQLIQGEKMSSLGQMVAGIAHEINNPTSFIYSNIQPAQSYIKDLLNLIDLYRQHYPEAHPEIQDWEDEIDLEFLMEDLPKLLTSMKVGASRIREIVLSLRTFSRLDEAEMKRVNIHEGIDSTLLILEHRRKAVGTDQGIAIVKQYGDLPPIPCYAGQLNQVFMNIISNSIDALETGVGEKFSGEKPTIQITTRSLDTQISIQIRDNGPGMTEEVKRRLFDPFFTTKPIGKGTGLGMSISYQIIQKHQGELHCFSIPGQGAIFTILLPKENELYT